MQMNPEELERLQLDAALGALPTEAEALLKTYLAEHPEQVSAGRAWQETVDLARESLVTDVSPAELPPLRMHARSRVSLPKLLAYGASLAACLALGIVLGRGMPPQAASPTVASPAPLVAGPLQARSEPTVSGSAENPQGSFWSTRRLYEYARQRPVHESPVKWESFNQWPHVGERT